MSSSEQVHEDVGTAASCSEPDEELQQCSSSPESDVGSVTTKSSIGDETLGSNSSGQSVGVVNDPNPHSKDDFIKNLLDKVDNDFREICLDDKKLKEAAESYLDSVIDFLTLGVAFSVYRDIKMGAYSASVVRMEQATEERTKMRTDIFGEFYDKEHKCVCSKCTKMVLASGFAVHLEVCMGIKQSRTRNTRRVAATTSSREQDSPTNESLPSSEDDDDGDEDWSCGGEKRKKKRERNGSKKVKGTPTKKTEMDSSDLMLLEEVDVENENFKSAYEEEEEEAEGDIFSLSEFFDDDSSQSFATASSAGSLSNGSGDETATNIE